MAGTEFAARRLLRHDCLAAPAGAGARTRQLLRLLTVLAVLGPLAFLLAGCAAPQGQGVSPRLGALGLFGNLNPLADSHAAYIQRAQQMPFSSLIYDTGDRRGLVVLGVASGEHTLWATETGLLLQLHADGLYATGGLGADLLHTRFLSMDDPGQTTAPPWRQDEPRTFRIERSWQNSQSQVLQMQARGELACGTPETRTLPLAEVRLQPCTLQLDWEDGRRTRGLLWRDPDQHHLWEVDEQPWPDGPRIRWQVARYWWAS